MEFLSEELLGMGFSQEQIGLARGATTLDEAVELIMARQEAVAARPAAMDEETRMVIVVRSDLKMSTGKSCSQVAHAAVGLFEIIQQSHRAVLAAWDRNNTPKICLRCDSLDELNSLESAAQKFGLPTCSICDAGRTEVAAGSKTCVAMIGTKQQLQKVTGHLKLL